MRGLIEEMRMQGLEEDKVEEFRYLSSAAQSSVDCSKEVKKTVQAGWNGWRKVSGVIRDKRISARVKGKFIIPW